jgi:hypothetical protein
MGFNKGCRCLGWVWQGSGRKLEGGCYLISALGFAKCGADGYEKLRIYRRGEHLVDRIDFEELALKGIDPSLGPSLAHSDLGGHIGGQLKVDEQSSKLKGKKRFTVSTSSNFRLYVLLL